MAKRKRSRRAPAKTSLAKLHEKLEPALTRWLKSFSSRHPRLLKVRPRAQVIQTATAEIDGYRYVLTRVRVEEAVPLTTRQREISLLVAEGHTNKDIADLLGLSPATVAAHLRTIFTKLGVRRRTALGQRARSF